MCSWKRALLASSLAALLGACGDDGPGSGDPGPGSRSWLIPAADKLDILFVIDDSESMSEEQERLAGDLSALFDRLQDQAGLPDLHVGVISTDVGTRQDIPGCELPGDDGALQSAFDQTDGSCNDGTVSLDGNFASSAPSDTPGTRDTNFTGSLTEVLGCMIKVGIDGCGFEQPLEAVRLAVDNPANDGFVRVDAVLAVVFVTDEDDCSASDLAMFDTADSGLTSPLGPLASFRCFEFGVQCSPDDARVLGDKLDCAPRQDSPYMPHTDEYVDFVKGLKPDPRQVVVAGIIGLDPGGPDEPLVVVEEERPVGSSFALEPACVLTDSSGSGGERVITEAAPAVRMRAFLEEFPDRNAVTSICAEDADNALDDVGSLVARAVSQRWCLDADVDLAPDVPGVQDSCQVSEQRFEGDELIETKTLEKCMSATPGAGELPCWRLVSQSDRCDVEGTVELVIERAEPVASGTLIDVRCAAE